MSDPKIDEGSLLAFWDKDDPDAISAETRRQIESSPELMALAQQLHAADESLTQRLERSACPSAHTLGEFQQGMLEDEEARSIARHASDCPHCSRELAQIVEFMDLVKADVDPGLVERAKRIVAELISGPPSAAAGPAWAMPAPAGIRGSSDERSWVYQAGEYQIAITAQADEDEPGRSMLIGLVIGPDMEDWRAELLDGEETLRVVPVNDEGDFEMLGVAPGSYDLRVVGDSFILDARKLEI